MPFTADTPIPLTAQQLQQVQAFLDAEDYPGGYRFLRDIIVEIGADQRVAWLDAAAHVNANDGTFWSEFVRGSTLASGDLVGRPITEAQFNEASADLAARVLTRVIQGQAIPSTSSIIQLDVQAAVEGLGLPAYAWSGTLGSPFVFFENTWTLFSGATAYEMGEQFAQIATANVGGGLYRALSVRDYEQSFDAFAHAQDVGLFLTLHYDHTLWTQPYELAEVAQPRESPLVLDLNGDGTTSVSSSAGAHFDHKADGFAEATGWVSAGDGFLVWDRDADGRIESGRELFGTETLLTNGQKAENGFAALAEWDANADGRIDSSDAVWSDLKIWQDADGDGYSTAGEFLTLAEADVQSIELAYSAGTGDDAQGNSQWLAGSFTRTDSTTGTMIDYLFTTNSTLTMPEEVVSVSAEIAALPDVVGYGKVYDLHQAMARDASHSLQDLVGTFATEGSQLARNALVEEIILKWTGAESVTLGSRGNWADARKLTALEAFVGRGFIGMPDPGYGPSSPNLNSWILLAGAYENLVESVYGQLMAQTHLTTQFDSITYSWDTQAEALRGDLAAVKTDFESAMAADFQAGVILASEFVRTAKGLSAEDTLNLAFLSNNPTLAKLVEGGVAVGGSEGDDVIIGSAFDDFIFGNAGDDSLAGDAGDDLIAAGEGTNQVWAGEGNDTVIGGSAVDHLEGGAGNDTLQGGAGDDRLVGDGGADVLEGGDGNEVMYGGSGEDTVDGGTGDDILYGNEDADTLNGGDGADILAAGSEDDVLNGDDGDDLLFGGAGDDVLDGGAGNDVLTGGDYSTNWQGVPLWGSLNGLGSDTYLFGRGSGQDTVNDVDATEGNVDRIVLGADVLPEDVTLRLAGGLILSINGTTDTLTVASWNEGTSGQIERIEFANGTVWDQSYLSTLAYTGTEGDDYIIASPDADTILGLGGNDALIGGAGDDVIDAGAGNDGVAAGAGNDNVIGGDGADQLEGGEGDDILDGGEGADTLIGEDGADTLDGGNGNDQLRGGTGADLLNAGAGDDVLYGNEGADTLNGADGVDILAAGSEDDVLNGQEGDDYLFGGAGDDVLDGGAGNDYVAGGDHAVNYWGAPIWGAANGLGNDTYLFGRGSGQDTVNDNDATEGNEDVGKFLSDVARDQIWFQQSGNNLIVSIIGTADSVTVEDWYSGSEHRLERFETAGGDVLLESQVQNLVDAMAAFTPPAPGEYTLPSAYANQLDAVIAANWQ